MDPKANASPQQPTPAATPQNMPPMNEPVGSHVNKAIIASLAVVLVALIGITYFFFKKTQDNKMIGKQDEKGEEMKKKKEMPKEVVAQPLPQVAVGTWKSEAPAPVVPASATVYKLKQSYTNDEINTFAGKIGAAERIENTDKAVVGYSSATSSVMMFYPSTGKYLYSSAVGLALPAGTSIEQGVYSFLTGLGMYDKTIKMTATYMRQDKPGVKFVELHRSWDDVHLPVLNSLGLANLPENTKLKDLSMSKAMPDDVKDANISQTSDKTDGYARKNDFNTITIGIDEATNKVISINSNIRVLEPTTSTAKVMTYEEIMTKIQNKQYDFFLSSPAGEGKMDITQVYPNNSASTDNAVITDVQLAYIEQPPAVIQTELVPHYVVRGYMQTKEGYRLKFTATVAASETQPAAWNRVKDLFTGFGVHAQVGDPGQKQDTLTFPTQGASPDINIQCQPSEADMNPIYEYQGMRIGYGARADKPNVYEWWYLNRAGLTEEQILANVKTLFENIPTGVDNSVSFREKVDKLVKEIQSTLQNCPVRFTGSSPTLFVYGDPGETVSVVSTGSTSYADPSTGSDSKWDVKVSGAGSLDVEGASRKYIYYEYAPVHYSQSQEGWRVAKSHIKNFAVDLGVTMQLNALETQRLEYELSHAASEISSDSVIVRPIAKSELDAKIPLSVQPVSVAVERYHFAVMKDDGSTLISPSVSPVNREYRMVLELGAVAQ